MNDFSYSDIERAQNEAYNMKSRSRFDDYSDFKCDCRFEKHEKNSDCLQNGRKCQSPVQKNIFDDDKMLILVLVLLLSKNSNDKLLIMALLYIIM